MWYILVTCKVISISNLVTFLGELMGGKWKGSSIYHLKGGLVRL